MLSTVVRKLFSPYPQIHTDVSYVSIRTKEHTSIHPLDALGRHAGLAEPRMQDFARLPVARRLEREGVGECLRFVSARPLVTSSPDVPPESTW